MQSVHSVQFVQFKQSAQFLQFTQLVQLMLPFSSATGLMLAEAFWFFMAFFSSRLVGVALPELWITRGGTHENGRTLRCDACNINRIDNIVKGLCNFFEKKF